MVIWCTCGCKWAKDGRCAYGEAVDLIVIDGEFHCIQRHAVRVPSLEEIEKHLHQTSEWRTRDKVGPVASITLDSTVEELLRKKAEAG